MNSRILYIDALRGMAILLVIIGHLIQYNYESNINSPIFNVIYSFHMPLFFFISGISLAISERIRNESFLKFVCNKLRLLILPSISWTLLVPMFLNDKIVHCTSSISSYWFLNVLFCIFLLNEILNRCLNSINFLSVKPFMIIILFSVFFILDIKRIPLWYFAMFSVGYYFYYYRLTLKLNGTIVSILLGAFLLLCGYHDYGDSYAGSPERIWLMMPLSFMASIVFIYLFNYAFAG